MNLISRCALLVATVILTGCGSGTFSSASFPWRPATSGESQDAINEALLRDIPYHGRIYIQTPHRVNDFAGKPKKQKTSIQISAFLRGGSTTKILDETVWVDAYFLDVIERTGDSHTTNITLRDDADGELFQITLRFDSTAKALRIESLSANVKRKKKG